jgi:hypothetical protein
VINFLSITPPFAKTAAISIFVIEPNNFSPPAFATILISIALKHQLLLVHHLLL